MADNRLGCREDRADGAEVVRCKQQLLDAGQGLDGARCTQLYYPAKLSRAFFFQVAFAALTFFSRRRSMAVLGQTEPGKLGSALA